MSLAWPHVLFIYVLAPFFSSNAKHWREVAKHVLFKIIRLNCKKLNMFIEIIVKSLFFIKLVKQYSALIYLTLNFESIETSACSESLYQVALDEIERGHWKYLEYIDDIELINGFSLNIDSANRLSALILSSSHIYHSVFEPLHFHFLSHITSQTRFNSVKKLIYAASGMTAIKSLNDALALCLNATEIMLKLHFLGKCSDELIQIEPNTVAEYLFVSTKVVFKGMANVEASAELLYYAHLLPRPRKILMRLPSFDGVEGCKLVLVIVASNVNITYSKLCLLGGTYDHVSTIPSLVVYLNQLGELDISSESVFPIFQLKVLQTRPDFVSSYNFRLSVQMVYVETYFQSPKSRLYKIKPDKYKKQE
ncbi:hypothetical protein EDC96DRAFT_561960 [Choanephora cucurbitarum]|nr:hypothetical protein EDC96DRAFT_561960 [Choanephora cucurbitarum]